LKLARNNPRVVKVNMFGYTPIETSPNKLPFAKALLVDSGLARN
jgi:hypothetical protein